MCGHGIIGVTTALLQCGILEAHEPETLLRIDTPAGFVEAYVEVTDGLIGEVTFVNVRSFVAGLDREVEVPGVGTVRYDMAFGGAFYVYVDADRFDLDLVTDEKRRIVELGRRIKAAVQEADPPQHPVEDDLGFVYGTIFVGPPHAEGSHSRNVCGSPTVRWTGAPREPESVAAWRSTTRAVRSTNWRRSSWSRFSAQTFRCRVLNKAVVGGQWAITPEITGQAFVTGRQEFMIDARDPLAEGFLLR